MNESRPRPEIASDATPRPLRDERGGYEESDAGLILPYPILIDLAAVDAASEAIDGPEPPGASGFADAMLDAMGDVSHTSLSVAWDIPREAEGVGAGEDDGTDGDDAARVEHAAGIRGASASVAQIPAADAPAAGPIAPLPSPVPLPCLRLDVFLRMTAERYEHQARVMYGTSAPEAGAHAELMARVTRWLHRLAVVHDATTVAELLAVYEAYAWARETPKARAEARREIYTRTVAPLLPHPLRMGKGGRFDVGLSGGKTGAGASEATTPGRPA